MLKSVLKSPIFSLQNKRWNLFFITAIIVCVAIVIFLFDPVTSKFFPPSPFRLLTGLYCPGCGTSRALHQLLHGNFGEALGLNPLMVISLPFLAYAYLSYAVEAIRGQPLPGIFLKAQWIWFLLEIIITYWVVRNIPISPFSWLAP